MKTNEKFEQIYSSILAENKSYMEGMRDEVKLENMRNGVKNEILRKVLTILILTVIGIILFYNIIIYSGVDHEEIGVLIQIYGGIAFGVYCIIDVRGENSKTLKYKVNFKVKVIRALLKSFNENIEYTPWCGISSSSYNEAEFEKYDSFRTVDLIKGTLKNNCNFEMSEVIPKQKSVCMVARIEIPKPFNAKFYLRKNSKDNNIISGALTKKLPFENLRVELDLPEFERYFDVYCTDKIIALQLLTADIMELLANFRKEMHMDYEVTLKNNGIYIKFMSGNMFEAPNVTKFSLDKNTLYKYYRMIDFSLTLTDKLVNLVKETEI